MILPPRLYASLSPEYYGLAAAMQHAAAYGNGRGVYQVFVFAVRHGYAYVRPFSLQREYAHEPLALASALHNGNVVCIISCCGKPVRFAEALLYAVKRAHKAAYVAPGIAVHLIYVKKAGQMVIFKLLTGVYESCALYEMAV